MPNEKVEQLFRVAREFRDWCREEPNGSVDPETDLRRCGVLLARLYAEGIAAVGPAEFDESIDETDEPESEWRGVYSRAGRLPFDFYSVMFDPHAFPAEEAVVGSLADDIADIDRDLGRALSLYDRGHLAEAQWFIVLHFRIHWGGHAASALHAIHCWNH